MFEEKPSGIQNFIQGLFSKLLEDQRKYQFIFFTTGHKKIENTAQHIKCKSKLMEWLEKIDHRLANIFFDNIYVLKLIRQYKINLFVAPSFILPIFKPKGVYFITVIHDLSFLKYKHNPLRIYMNLVMYMKTVMPFILRRADVVVVPSCFVKNELERVYHVNPQKVKVIYEGRDEFFYPQKIREKFAKIQKEYGIGEKYLFTTATNQERKNVPGLIRAFKEIKQFSDYQLIISGLLPKQSIIELKQFISGLKLMGKIKFLGFVSKEELRTLYSFAKLFVYPSFEEGFGLPILESSLCGCLPVCSDAGALPEVIGNKDLLFNPKDQKNMTDKLDEVLSLDQKAFDQCLSVVRKHINNFSWQKTAKEYTQLFDELLCK